MAIHERTLLHPIDADSAAVSAKVKATDWVKETVAVELSVVGLARRQKAEGRRE
jgi:hypothetical protein